MSVTKIVLAAIGASNIAITITITIKESFIGIFLKKVRVFLINTYVSCGLAKATSGKMIVKNLIFMMKISYNLSGWYLDKNVLAVS